MNKSNNNPYLIFFRKINLPTQKLIDDLITQHFRITTQNSNNL